MTQEQPTLTPGQRFAASFIRASVEASDRQPCITVDQLGDGDVVEDALIFGYVKTHGYGDDLRESLVQMIGTNLDRYAAQAVAAERAAIRQIIASKQPDRVGSDYSAGGADALDALDAAIVARGEVGP